MPTLKRIRKAVKAQLLARLPSEDETYTGIQIFAGRAVRLASEDFEPNGFVITISTQGGQSSSISVQVPSFDTTDELVIVGQCRLLPGAQVVPDTGEALHDRVDDLEQAILTSLLTSRSFLGANFKQLVAITSKKEMEPLSNDVFEALLMLTFSFVRSQNFAPAAEPGAPDPDLDTLNMQVMLDSSGWVTLAGSSLVTQDEKNLVFSNTDYLLRPLYRGRWVTLAGNPLVTLDGDSLILSSQGHT